MMTTDSFNLPEEFNSLSPARRRKLFNICTIERQDAALNGVIIGLKCLNQINGMGLDRLANLSTVWGQDITNWYSNKDNEHWEGWSPETVDPAGPLIADVEKEFFDLSDRKRRKIREYLDEERKDSQWNACSIGIATMRKELHFGDVRIGRLVKQWQRDIVDFYEDRDINEPRLQAWIEDIGFYYDGKRLQTYNLNGKRIKKAAAEKLEAESEEKE